MSLRTHTLLPATLASAAALALAAPAPAAITFYDVFYNVYYHQTSDAAPTAPSDFAFASRIITDNPADLASAAVTLPAGGAPFDLPGSGFVYVGFEFGPSLADLNARYPVGLYTFHTTGGFYDGAAASLSREPFFFTADIPAFTDSTYSSMQNVESAQGNTLFFNSFTPGAGANIGLIFFTLFDDESGDVVQNDILPSSETSATIDANVMLPSHRYRATIYYSSRVELRDQGFGGATSIVGNDLVTDFTFTTLTPCAPDFNRDGILNPDDLADFIACFFTPPCDRADYNHDTFTDPDDLADFISAYFAGCN